VITGDRKAPLDARDPEVNKGTDHIAGSHLLTPPKLLVRLSGLSHLKETPPYSHKAGVVFLRISGFQTPFLDKPAKTYIIVFAVPH